MAERLTFALALAIAVSLALAIADRTANFEVSPRRMGRNRVYHAASDTKAGSAHRGAIVRFVPSAVTTPRPTVAGPRRQAWHPRLGAMRLLEK